MTRSESTHPEHDSPLNRIIPLMNLTFEFDDRKYFLPTVEKHIDIFNSFNSYNMFR